LSSCWIRISSGAYINPSGVAFESVPRIQDKFENSTIESFLRDMSL